MEQKSVLSGIFNINKPAGVSSAKCVSTLKYKLIKEFGNKNIKIGHMGTLDPMGIGVLLIGVGKATKLFDWYLKHDKTYIADFVFGTEYDTLDTTGTVVQTTEILPTFDQIKNTLNNFVGKLSQIPPIYSAKSINGVRAYDLARQGKSVDLKPCDITVHKIELIDRDDISTDGMHPANESLDRFHQVDKNTFRFCIDCSSGTYIRSLGRDIAYSLNSLASMSYINRTRCENFYLKDSKSLEDIKSSDIVPLEKCLPNLDRYDIDGEMLRDILDGKKIILDKNLDTPHIIYVGNVLYGIGQTVDKRLVIQTNLFEQN